MEDLKLLAFVIIAVIIAVVLTVNFQNNHKDEINDNTPKKVLQIGK